MTTATVQRIDTLMTEVLPLLIAEGWRLVLFSPYWGGAPGQWQANLIHDDSDRCRAGYGTTAAEAIADGTQQALRADAVQV